MIIIKITFHMFYFYWGEESCSLYQGICYNYVADHFEAPL